MEWKLVVIHCIQSHGVEVSCYTLYTDSRSGSWLLYTVHRLTEWELVVIHCTPTHGVGVGCYTLYNDSRSGS